MSLHDRIMNLPTGKDCPEELPARLLYKQGHRDARHASAELSLEADDLMAEMVEILDCCGMGMVCHNRARAMVKKYNTYKERNNEQ